MRSCKYKRANSFCTQRISGEPEVQNHLGDQLGSFRYVESTAFVNKGHVELQNHPSDQFCVLIYQLYNSGASAVTLSSVYLYSTNWKLGQSSAVLLKKEKGLNQLLCTYGSTQLGSLSTAFFHRSLKILSSCVDCLRISTRVSMLGE